jgi:hypothetical protein
MKNWWYKLGCFLTGWNSKILESCTESSRKQLKKYASALLILIILWGLIGYLFAERYVRIPWWGCAITAVFMIVIVLQIERQIILTVGNLGWLKFFRFLIAFIMAIIGSAIIDQIIFKEDIEKKMVEIVDRQVNEQLPNRLTIIDDKLQDLQMEVDSLDKKNLDLYAEISKNPTIETIATISAPITIRKPDGTDTIMFRTTISKNPIPNPKVKEAEINNQHLDILRKQKEEYTQRKMDAENLLRQELKSKQGFLEELNAIIEILIERPAALIFYLVLFVFLMSLELFVVASKLGDKKCDYDLIVEFQLDQKTKTLKELMK